MGTVQQIVVYFFLFIGIYFQVFVLLTYLINRSRIKAQGSESFERSVYPSVTIVVPAWNEEKTVGKTIQSLLNLNYPKDKLSITVVDDGSTDGTWNILEGWKAKYPEITIYKKKNGGKYTALNYAIERTNTELVGCLDADSFVDPDSLKKIACRFENPETMAVTPAMKIYKPTTITQLIQSTDYLFGILMKKVMSIIGAIHVTQGPFSIFRRSVFEKIGPFRRAHNTEDMEIAFRMQAHHMKIDNVHNAWVYTTGPNTVRKLYRQRVRWTYGFIQNVRDYKYLFFNRKYGNIGMITLPTGLILIFGVLFSVYFVLFRIYQFMAMRFFEWQTVGFMRPRFDIGLFYISTKAHILLIVFIYLLMITLIINAQRIADEKAKISKSVLLYFVLYPVISPFWILKSIFNAAFSKKTSWQ
jgi:cellulose synthase/poly-beta-1,6-N-acetylglucosamine synthase-like glycosyltransferase